MLDGILDITREPTVKIIHLHLASRRRYVTRAALRKYSVTIGCSACSDIAVHGKTSKLHTEKCRNRIDEGHERLQAHKRRRDVEPEVEAKRTLVARENEGDSALQERQDVEMPVEAPVESASAKRGSDAVADKEERARLRLRAQRERDLKHDKHDVLEPQVKTREEEVSSTVLVASYAAPIQRGSSSSTNVLVNSSVTPSMSVGDMVQLWCSWIALHESMATDFEKFPDLVLTSTAFPGRPSRESKQGLVKTCLEMCAIEMTEVYSSALFNERSMQLGLSAGVAAELGTCWNLDTNSRRDERSIELRTARPKILIANPPRPLLLKLQKSNIGKSNQLDSTENTIITTRSSHMCSARVL